MIHRPGVVAISFAAMLLAACGSIASNQQGGELPERVITRPSSEAERLKLAYHQAGHAIAHLQLGLPFEEVSIEGYAAADASVSLIPDFPVRDLNPPRSPEDALVWGRVVGGVRALGRWTAEEEELAFKTIRAMAAGPLAELYFESLPYPQTLDAVFRSVSARDAEWMERLAWGRAIGQIQSRFEPAMIQIATIKNMRVAVLTAQVGIERDWAPIQTLATELALHGSLSYAEVVELVSAQLPDPSLTPRDAYQRLLRRESE